MLDALWPHLTLFGEWCYAVHSVRYDALPDWLLGFDVYDRRQGRFWSVDRRDALLAELGLTPVPEVARGRFDEEALVEMAEGPSAVGREPREGIYVRREVDGWLAQRAKLVRPSFVQAIDEHWSRRPLDCNRLAL